jgi:hypothetical protein
MAITRRSPSWPTSPVCPKSSISRYVSDQMAKGFLEEYIDPQDRRRRRLRPTKAARRELREHWHAEIEATYKQAVSDQDNPTIRADAEVDEIIAYLKGGLAATLPPARKGLTLACNLLPVDGIYTCDVRVLQTRRSARSCCAAPSGAKRRPAPSSSNSSRRPSIASPPG